MYAHAAQTNGKSSAMSTTSAIRLSSRQTGPSIKIQGFFIDISHSLSWNAHVEAVSKKANNAMSFLETCVHGQSCYNSSVQPQLYGSRVQDPQIKSNISKLEAIRHSVQDFVRVTTSTLAAHQPWFGIGRVSFLLEISQGSYAVLDCYPACGYRGSTNINPMRNTQQRTCQQICGSLLQHQHL